MAKSDLERTLIYHMKIHGLPTPAREYHFATRFGRQWRFDLALVDLRLAVEAEGMVHRIKDRFKGDAYKYLAAQALGWEVLRFTGEMIRKGEAVRVLGAHLGFMELHPRCPSPDVIEELIELQVLERPEDW